MITDKYHYELLRGKWVIYKGEILTDMWFPYGMKEAARKKVYELNGWKYNGARKEIAKPLFARTAV